MSDPSTLPPDAASPSPRLTRRKLLRWISLSAASGVMGCGGGGGNDDDASDTAGPELGPGPGPITVDPTEPKAAFSKAGKGVPGTPVTPAQRAQALDALNTQLNQLYDSTLGIASPARTLAWLAQQDAYQTIGYSATRNVYAVFTDGRPIIIATNTRIDAAGISDGPPRPANAPPVNPGLRALAAPRSPAAAALPSAYEAGIPSRQMRYLNTWFGYGSDWPAGVWCRAGLSSMSDIGEAAYFMQEFGYQPVGGSDAFSSDAVANTVEGLKQVSGDGVFFWSTHGGTLDPGGNIIQGLMTATEAYKSTVEDTYKDEFAEGTLIYYTGPLCMDPIACKVRGSPGTHLTRLAITPKFIQKYKWKFGQHSLVFVNACASATGAMKQAFLDAGASVYIGWTKPVRLWAMCGAALDFFSLMLGLNENGGYKQGDEVNPFQRPYDWGAVMDHLHANTQAAYHLDEEDGIVELEPTFNSAVPAGFLGLRPSIYWSAFDESRSELTLIGGVFGTRPGSAAIGPDMPVDKSLISPVYGMYGILADRRISQPVPLTVLDWRSENLILKLPADGPGAAGIVQLDVDGRWSNGAQLTRVNFPLSASKTFGGSLSVQVDAQLSFRGDFRGVRLDPVQDLTYLPLVSCSTPPTATGSFIATGTYSYSEGSSTVTVEWSGSGVVGPIAPGAPGVYVTGTVTPKSRGGAFMVSIMGSGIRERMTIISPGLEPRVTVRSIGFGIASQIGGEAPFSIAVGFSPAYAAGVVTQAYTATRSSTYNSADQATRIACGPFTAEYPPEERLGGR